MYIDASCKLEISLTSLHYDHSDWHIAPPRIDSTVDIRPEFVNNVFNISEEYDLVDFA